jgi:hypothetical protein
VVAAVEVVAVAVAAEVVVAAVAAVEVVAAVVAAAGDQPFTCGKRDLSRIRHREWTPWRVMPPICPKVNQITTPSALRHLASEKPSQELTCVQCQMQKCSTVIPVTHMPAMTGVELYRHLIDAGFAIRQSSLLPTRTPLIGHAP